MAPELALLSPVDISIAPELDAVDVSLVSPVRIVMAPVLKLPATASAVCTVTAPVTLVSDAPPVTVIAPPFKFVEPPADKAMVLPAPLVLLPTVMLIAPPWAALEEPLVIDT